ncbi:hypothetical protein [Streptomyces sp. NBC_01022]|uniref:hypothetical protein n=1 Tax=Streptomyces sp. NBC_01022 TaxID=2903723 RepID=UPI002DD8DC7D|nr:hypothetical protein [Streptomyces sp. NBC_01022]WRZ79946.1 hypothetical protein OG316_06560 [Streptomyces sp. NBC_01022]
MDDRPTRVRLTGDVHPADYFCFVEREEIDWELWTDVLRGRVLGVIFRGALAPEVCERIRRNFWSSPILKQAGSNSPNGYGCGPQMVGANGLDRYLDAAEQTRAGVDALFTGVEDRAVPALLDDYRGHLARQGVNLRLAERHGRRAGSYKLRSREASGAYSLVPHDDADTIRRAPYLRGFEVQSAQHVCNALACVENGPGGALTVWNIAPDAASRRALGFGDDSYGYPQETLSGFQKVTVPVEAGDMYVFDVSKVHAVGRRDEEGTYRSTIQWSMSFLDSTTVLHWC